MELSLRAMTGHSQGHDKTGWGWFSPRRGEQESANCWQQKQAQQFPGRRAFCMKGHGAPVSAEQQGRCPYVQAFKHLRFRFPGSVNKGPWKGSLLKEDKQRREWKARGGTRKLRCYCYDQREWKKSPAQGET